MSDRLKMMLCDDPIIIGQDAIVMHVPSTRRNHLVNYDLVEIMRFIMSLSMAESVHPVELYLCARAQGIIMHKDVI